MSQALLMNQELVLKSARKAVLINKDKGQDLSTGSGISKTISPTSPEGKLLSRLHKLPFYCKNDTLHLDYPKDYHTKFCCISHVVGLPTHPATQLPMPITDFQMEFVERVIDEVTNNGTMSDKEWSRLSHKFHVLKGRQMGFTEITLRLIQYFSFSRYAGQNIGIMAATNGNLAKQDLIRFARLFKNIRIIVSQGVKAGKFILVDGTNIEAFAASEEAMTGLTNFACVFLDESAKWKLVNDDPVFNSILPIIDSNGSDLFLVSTPKGPLKMFYEIYKDPKDYVMLKYDIWRTEGNMYNREQIEEMLNTSKVDPNQEYLCQFTIGANSILGAVTPEDKSNFNEWIDSAGGETK